MRLGFRFGIFTFFLYFVVFTEIKIGQKQNEFNYKTIEHFLGEEDKRSMFEEEKKPVDIGFPAARLSRSAETKLKMEQRQHLKKNPEIEKLSRHLQCKTQI